MKKIRSAAVILASAVMMSVMTGCAQGLYEIYQKETVPKDWYDGTLDYLKSGFESDWTNVSEDTSVPYIYKDKNIKFGYLLKDLDGDGAEELLVGLMDGSEETKFTNLYVWHSDFGAINNMSTDDENFMYLYDNNVIRMDTTIGKTTRSEFMEYDHKSNSYHIVDPVEGKPGKYTLTAF